MRFQSLSKLLLTMMMSQLILIQAASADPSPELVYNLKGTIVKVHTVTKLAGRAVVRAWW